MQLGTIIRQISLDLNDQEPGHEYVRWPLEQLQSYVQEALIELSAVYRSLFMKQLAVRVEAGNGWQRACDCTHITNVLGESDANGNVIRNLVKADNDNGWPGMIGRCVTHKTELESFAINAADDREFKVFPPIIPGVEKYILVECYAQPDGEDLGTDVPARLVAAIKQWALYRAMAVDSENNPTITQLANQHQQTYFTLYKALAAEAAELEVKQHGSSVRAAQNGTPSGVPQRATV